MAVDVLFEVWNATVTDLDCVSVSVRYSFRKVPPMLVDTFLLNRGLFVVYLVNKPLWAAGMSGDNAQG